MIPDYPVSRVEIYLAAILGQDAALPTPQTRSELFWANLAGGTWALPAPQSREEIFLAYILGDDSLTMPTPQSRVELFLAKVAGMDVELPEPASREELYLAEWVEEGGGIYRTVSGNPVLFTARRAAPLRKLEVAIEPVQSGTGDPSPDNVRAIKGWPYTDSVNFVLHKTGKNLFNPQWLSKSGKYVNFYGSHTTSSSDYFKRSRGIYMTAGKTYRIYVDPGLESAASWGIYAIRTGSTSQITIKGAASRTKLNETYTPSYSGWYWFWLYASAESTVTSIDLDNLIVYIAEGSDAYNADDAAVGTSIIIENSTPPGMVYGGTLDVLTGVLTVTHGNIASYAGESIGEPWISSMDVYAPGVTPTTGAQVVHPLAQPQTYQLTPSEVQTLVGVNNLWSGTGQVTVEYRSN